MAGFASNHLVGTARGASTEMSGKQTRVQTRVQRHERQIAELQRKVKSLETAQRMQAAQNTPKATMNLHDAAKTDSIPQLRSALNAGAKVDLKNSKDETPLMVACAGGKIRAARYLLVNGADPSAKGKERATPLSLANKSGNQDLMTMLIEYGAR